MLKTDLDRKIFMAQSFLDSANLNERTRIFSIEVNSPEEAEAKLVDTKRNIKIVTHFLYCHRKLGPPSKARL